MHVSIIMQVRTKHNYLKADKAYSEEIISVQMESHLEAKFTKL